VTQSVGIHAIFTTPEGIKERLHAGGNVEITQTRHVVHGQHLGMFNSMTGTTHGISAEFVRCTAKSLRHDRASSITDDVKSRL
jgi:hypothetical protein